MRHITSGPGRDLINQRIAVCIALRKRTAVRSLVIDLHIWHLCHIVAENLGSIHPVEQEIAAEVAVKTKGIVAQTLMISA